MAGALALAAVSSPASAQDVPAGSLRIATYNAYLLSPAFKCLAVTEVFPDCWAQIAGETEGWADKLASMIIAHRSVLDVVAINEAWDEEAKAILVTRLAPFYPVRVRKIDKSLIDVRAKFLATIPEEVHAAAGVRLNGEDSGLMLFAKSDFEAVALPDATYRWGSGTGQTLEATTPHVAFTYFDKCGDFDCFSAKGAGLIRLRHKASGAITNVVLTHMQADYPDAGDFYVSERDAQFGQVKTLIEKTLGPEAMGRIRQGSERLVFMGDLNVPYLRNDDEFRRRFDQPGFFRNPLYETWHHSSSRLDRTATNEIDDERLDYILASPSETPPGGAITRWPCVQHVTVPILFRELESDHAMVHADIATGFYHCSPALAFKVSLSNSNTVVIDTAGGIDVTGIRSSGAMQWFLVDTGQEGTYSIGTDNPAAVRIEVYAPEDMTRPISRYNQTPRPAPPSAARSYETNQYYLPRRFYVRTRGDVRTRLNTNYSLYIERHTCASKAKACILQPGRTHEAKLTSAWQPQPQNEAWFRWDVTGTPTSNKPQTITLDATLANSSQVTAELVEVSSANLLGSSGSGTRRFEGQAPAGAKGYLVIKQSQAGASPRTVTAKLDSNIRYLRIGNLICTDETNPESGSDDIFTRVTIDGDPRRAPSSGYVEFDCDNHNDPEQWGPRIGVNPIVYTQGVSFGIAEDDDTSADDSSRRKAIPALKATESDRMEGKLEWRFDDGAYRLKYDLMRRLNGPVSNF